MEIEINSNQAKKCLRCEWRSREQSEKAMCFWAEKCLFGRENEVPKLNRAKAKEVARAASFLRKGTE